MDNQETGKATVYIETSVISYLTARPSRDIIVGAQQQLTADWWENQRSKYALFVSTFVVEEAVGGNATAAIRRLDTLTGITVLEVTDEITRVAAYLLQCGAVPQTAVQDALHIAISAVYRIQFLMTWNYKHIANAVMRDAINEACRAAGYHAPVICTPVELGGIE